MMVQAEAAVAAKVVPELKAVQEEEAEAVPQVSSAPEVHFPIIVAKTTIFREKNHNEVDRTI